MMPDGAVAHVLVVDDNAPNRLVAEAHLMSAGYRVTVAASGDEALQRFVAEPPDLVLLDVLMPGMDGFETCRRLRDMPDGRHVPVLFLTALSDPGVLMRALDSGGDDLIVKPVNRVELLLRCRSLLRIGQLHRDREAKHAELVAAHERLIRAEQQRNDLISLLVHDLRSPLTAILFEVIHLQSNVEIPDRVVRMLRSVRGAAEQMNRMLLNLIDVSRSEEGRLVVREEDIDPAALVSECCSRVVRRAAERSMRLRVQIAPGLPVLRGDRDLLARMIENLLDNSLKYAPPGGTITVEAEVVTGDAAVELRVRDEGPGIPDEWRDRVFEKYERLDREAERVARISQGLGLTFCRAAAQAHGGRIWVEANVPHGCVFRVRLPTPDLVATGGPVTRRASAGRV